MLSNTLLASINKISQKLLVDLPIPRFAILKFTVFFTSFIHNCSIYKMGWGKYNDLFEFPFYLNVV